MKRLIQLPKNPAQCPGQGSNLDHSIRSKVHQRLGHSASVAECSALSKRVENWGESGMGTFGVHEKLLFGCTKLKTRTGWKNAEVSFS